MENDNIFVPADFTPDAVVIDNGEFPSHPKALRWLDEAPYLVCCDGAADNLLSYWKKPDVIIGDCDSISPENAESYAEILHRISEQETNDQTKAIRYLHSLQKDRIVILGGTGKREDHTLGNISLLIDYYRAGIFAMMATDYGTFIPCRGEVGIKSYKGQQISIFNFGAVHFHSEHLVYPLSELNNWWQGTLNEATDDNITLSAADGYYLVFMAY